MTRQANYMIRSGFKIFMGLGLSLLAAVFLFRAPAALADCAQNTALTFVANDPSGSFIPNANVTVYKQVIDANGQPKPGTPMASGNTDPTIGSVTLSWRDSLATDTYVVRVRTVNNDQASFWYYNNTWDCGQNASLSQKLSGILFALHDENGNLLTNTGFNVYSQIYSGGQPTKQLQQSLAGLSTGSSGQTAVYLPQGSVRSLDKTPSDVYALDLSRNGQRFDYYNIPVTDGAITTVNYFIPAISVRLQDASGALYPKGTNVTVFKQTVDANNLPAAGNQVGSFTLANDGTGSLEIPTGLYVLGIKGQNNAYQYFWNIDVSDGQSNNYNLTASSTPSTGTLTTSCQNSSQLTITLRTAGGSIVPGLHFAVYVQSTDANGLPIAGNQVGSGTISASGEGSTRFTPDPRNTYAIKVWDRNSNLGAFWFYSAVRFACSYDQAVTETVPAITVVLRDHSGNLLRNYNFSLYAQEYDADNNPYFSSADQIASYSTDGGGEALVYVPAYNPYVPGQSGVYALSVRDNNNNTENFYNIKASATKDSTFTASFSGLSGRLTNALGQPLANKNLDLYSEVASGGLYSLDKKLTSLRTDNNGNFQLEYPAGSYALVSYDDFNQPNVFWNASVNSSAAAQTLATSLINFRLSDPQGQGISNNPSLALYALSGQKGVYYRGNQVGTVRLTGNTASMSLAAGPYLAVYSGLGNQNFGQAFYAKNGSQYSVNVALSSKYLVSSSQAFYLSGVPANAVPASNNNSGNNSGGTPAGPSSGAAVSGLAATLKGRILLQVQDKGQAWYVNPVNGQRYSLGSPTDAFNVMRQLALGISNANFNSLQNNPSAWRSLAGRILLKVQDGGKAYYFDPTNLNLYYLGRPTDAFNVMRTRGLGITNSNLSQIKGAN